MTLAHRVVVLRDGQIEQVGTPLELYYRPNNQFVAQFIGTPQMNMVAGPDVGAVRSGAEHAGAGRRLPGPASRELDLERSRWRTGARRASSWSRRWAPRRSSTSPRRAALSSWRARTAPAICRDVGDSVGAADRRRGRPSVRLARSRRSGAAALISSRRSVHVGPARDAPSGARLLPSRAPGAVHASADRIRRQRLGAGRRQHPAGHAGADGEPRGSGRRLHAGDRHARRRAKLHQDHGDQDRRAV